MKRWIPLLLVLLIFGTGCHKNRGPKVKKRQREIDATATVALYEMGTNSLVRGREVQARDYFQGVEPRTDAGDLAMLAQVREADAFYQEGSVTSLPEAVARYKAFLAFHPSHPEAAYAQYMMGLCRLSQTRPPDRDPQYANQAIAAFRGLRQRWPDSPYTRMGGNLLGDAPTAIGLA